MNWKDEEIDKLFQDNADSGSFEYKEAYWKEMEALLPNKRGSDVLWMLTAILFIGWLGITPFVSGLDKSNALIAQLNSDVIEYNGATSNSENAFKNTKDEVNGTIIDESYESNSVNEQINNGSVTREKSNIRIENKANNSIPETTTVKDQSYSVNKSATENSTEEANSLAELTITDDLNDSNTKENIEPSVNKQTIETDDSSDLPEVVNIEEPSAFNIEESDVGIGQLPLRALISTYATNDSEIESIASDLKMPIRTQLYVSAIGGLSQSMITPSDEISYSFGIGIGAKINKGRFTFITGINWMWAYHNDLLLTREAKQYGFGSELTRYELRYDEIISIEGDFSIGYQFGNSAINVGLRPSYILGTKINVREDDIYGASTIETHYGFTEGLNRVGLKPVLGYTYQFRHGLSLGMNVGIQAMPLVNEKFINGENNTLPVDGQIFLRKTLKSN